MVQFFTECFAWVNIPWTILMVLTGLYWLVTSFGAVEIRGLDVEMSDELRLGTRGGSPEPPQRQGFARLVSSFLKFMHYGQAPLIFIVTVFAGAGWIFSVVGNYFLNLDENLLSGLGWGLVSFLVACVSVNIWVKPIARFFRNRTPKHEEREAREIVGQPCLVRSLDVTESNGQVEVKFRAAPLIVDARVPAGQRLYQGDRAFVSSYDREAKVFQISLTDPRLAVLEEAAAELPPQRAWQ